MMKMYRPLLRMVSVFFSAIILLNSCGIATYFNLTSGSIQAGNTNGEVVYGIFKVTDNNSSLSMISPGTGPSLVLSYIVTDSPDPPAFITPFKTNYRRSIYNGVPIRSQELLSITSSDEIYRLHIFNDSAETHFRSPRYIAVANDPLQVEDTFRLQRVDESANTYSMLLSFDAGLYTYNGNGTLRRYDGTLFTSDQTTILHRPENYPDYTIRQPGSRLYLHIYGAVSVGEGMFSNIYWTELTHFGYINLE